MLTKIILMIPGRSKINKETERKILKKGKFPPSLYCNNYTMYSLRALSLFWLHKHPTLSLFLTHTHTHTQTNTNALIESRVVCLSFCLCNSLSPVKVAANGKKVGQVYFWHSLRVQAQDRSFGTV